MNWNRSRGTGECSFIMCMAMIFMIVITGMCCRIGQADSLFCAVTAKETQATFLVEEILTDASEECTQELLRKDGMTAFSNYRMVRTRMVLRFILFFIFAGISLQYLKYILRAAWAEVYHQIRSNAVILYFIHHQDGKKR